MRATRLIMGMPLSVEIVGAPEFALERVFAYFTEIDERFSTYKETSEISKINRGELTLEEWSPEMREVFDLAQQTSRDTGGFFSILRPDGIIDPSGIVKGWSIRNAATLIENLGYQNYFLNVGGDIASAGAGERGEPWTVGIRNPFESAEIVKIIVPRGRGVATSGNYIRGDHIYDPHDPARRPKGVISITVVARDIYEADRFATAAYAMGERGIGFIESLEGVEGYTIDEHGVATMTSGFNTFTA